ncbi:aldehyde dehydrogenase family protein [Erythrobacter litoralis]|nr:aldehyde dehydrogenase family protein [Erythrobacter litoralis]
MAAPPDASGQEATTMNEMTKPDLSRGAAFARPPEAADLALPAPALDAPGTGEGQTLVYAAREEPFAFVPHTAPGEADALVAAARDAFETGPWRSMPVTERAATLRRVSALVRDHADELARLQTLETSIVISQSRGMHVARTAENFTFFADLLAGHSGESYEQSGRYLSIVTREPVGVAVLIAPWNAPLVLASMKLAAALSLGNSVILKPSEYAPLAVLRLAELVREAGVPDGVVQVACGTGPGIGNALVSHPGVDVVGFIGGTETGKRIMASAAGSLKKVGLELGGKSANIILASADLERAVDGSLMGIFAGNGEQCLAGSRILVEESVADEFTARFTARTKALKVGDPFDPASEIGPMAFAAHFEKLLAFGETAHSDPAYTVLAGGKRVEGMEKGYFFAPTVVEACDNSTTLCQTELFGPFVTIQRVQGLDEALAIANESEFGLASYIWSDDLPSVMRARRVLRAGTVWVNTPMARDLRSPFGGYKQSGIGRDGLPGSIELFTEEKTTLIPQEPLDLPKMGAGEG